MRPIDVLIPAFTWALAGLALAADVTSQVTVTVGPSKDNPLYEPSPGDPPLSNGAGSRCFCGKTATNTRRRAVLAFEFRGVIPFSSLVRAGLEMPWE